MVLQELGSKLTSALRRLQTESVVDTETIKGIVGDICRALLESDVNVQMVMKLRKSVEAKAVAGLSAEGSTAGAAQRRSIQKAVMDELTSMLDPKTPAYKMKKGKSNVVMFVGLQVGPSNDLVRLRLFSRKPGVVRQAAQVCICHAGLNAYVFYSCRMLGAYARAKSANMLRRPVR